MPTRSWGHQHKSKGGTDGVRKVTSGVIESPLAKLTSSGCQMSHQWGFLKCRAYLNAEFSQVWLRKIG
ncbi:hypothetical protein [Candidatus Methylacidithermus pantelleriae]|uniref:hypothetical protein n=1 Tax=Candidatus Methylacidithermus pantelleriae TaxID=2744239 RepID=UPI00157C28B7|nr:hypothetical protein [Candidatus Methylacidithermus pantelleriae]